jgi:tight adherence protein C
VIIYVVVLLFATSIALAVVGIAELLPGESRLVTRQLQGIARLSRGEAAAVATSTERKASARARLAELLGRMGKSMQRRESRGRTIRDLLVQAGYRRPEAVSVFWGTRLAILIALPVVCGGTMLLLGVSAQVGLFAMVWAALVAWLGPKLYLRLRGSARRTEIDRTLPDALDLLVVCMEAGLGLNQAIVRMADEIRHFSPATSDEFVLLNLEMRAGVPRAEALRRLGTRMGVPDLRSLSTMLIQADRFGTSVGQALRVHADTARTRRRQRAEEAAAKTTIKLIFPVVLCVFPSVFVVVLGPAVLGLIRSLADL